MLIHGSLVRWRVPPVHFDSFGNRARPDVAPPSRVNAARFDSAPPLEAKGTCWKTPMRPPSLVGSAAMKGSASESGDGSPETPHDAAVNGLAPEIARWTTIRAWSAAAGDAAASAATATATAATRRTPQPAIGSDTPAGLCC